MRASTVRSVAHGGWLGTMALWLVALVIVLVSSPSRAVPLGLLGLPMATYASVGALVARTSPRNPIGWLFSSVGLALALWMFGLAYAQVGLVGTGIGDLPGAAAAAWIGVLSLLALLPVALPVFLLLFPDGRLRSRRWRPVLWATGLAGGLLTVGAVGQVWDLDPLFLLPPAWAARIPGIDQAYDAGLLLLLAAAFAGLLALILRFRESSTEQRQSLRLLVGVIVAMAVATALAIVTVLASAGADWSWIAIVLALLIDWFGVLIGIPLATAAAVLTFGLYDVGVVVKKTVVYVLLVIFFLALLGLISLMVTPLAFLGTGGANDGPRTAVARIATAVSVFVVILVVGFRPAKRLARRVVYGKRSTPYEAMNEFAERLGETYSTDDVLPRMAQIVRASTGAVVARVWLRVDRELRAVASAPADAADIPAVPVLSDESPQISDLRVFPVRDRGELLGALTVAMPQAEPLSKTGEQLVNDLAGQAGLVLRNVRLVEELQESRRRIVTAQDERARKLERDIHDGAQQQLVALTVKLGLAERLLRDPAKAAQVLAELRSDASDALENLRDIARGIYPPLLADQGLEAALNAQARKSPMPVRLDADGCGRFSPEEEAAVYFCVLEALQNAAKYANAGHVDVRLRGSNGNLAFEVVDDGDGFDADVARGSGLTNMRDRLEALGGSLEVETTLGRGTSVRGSIPVEARA